MQLPSLTEFTNADGEPQPITVLHGVHYGIWTISEYNETALRCNALIDIVTEFQNNDHSIRHR